MRKYNISANLDRTIEQLYDKATSAVQMNGSNRRMVQIMSDALEEHDGKVSIGGRNITSLPMT